MEPLSFAKAGNDSANASDDRDRAGPFCMDGKKQVPRAAMHMVLSP